MVIFEVGLNHLGDEKYANHYIKSFLKSNAEAITFQIRENSFYKKHFRNHKLSFKYYNNISRLIKNNKKKLGVALADINQINMCEDIGITFYKVLSHDLNNYKLIDSLINTKKIIYVSTGMSSISEIDQFYNRYKLNKELLESIILIHTQTSYQTEDVNLNAINLLKNRYPFKIAYGSHSKNHNVIFTSIAYKPYDIFIYVHGNKNIKHPDQLHSISTNLMSEYVKNISECYLSLGNPVKNKMRNAIDDENNIYYNAI